MKNKLYRTLPILLFLIIPLVAAQVELNREVANQLADWLEFGGAISLLFGFLSFLYTLFTGEDLTEAAKDAAEKAAGKKDDEGKKEDEEEGERIGKIAGYVYDKETRQPVPAADVWIEGTSISTKTIDEEEHKGAFILEEVPTNRGLVVRAKAEDYREGAHTDPGGYPSSKIKLTKENPVFPKRGEEGVLIQLEKVRDDLGKIWGRVVEVIEERRQRAPEKQLTVVVKQDEHLSATTDSEGRFIIQNVRLGERLDISIKEDEDYRVIKEAEVMLDEHNKTQEANIFVLKIELKAIVFIRNEVDQPMRADKVYIAEYPNTVGQLVSEMGQIFYLFDKDLKKDEGLTFVAEAEHYAKTTHLDEGGHPDSKVVFTTEKPIQEIVIKLKPKPKQADFIMDQIRTNPESNITPGNVIDIKVPVNPGFKIDSSKSYSMGIREGGRDITLEVRLGEDSTMLIGKYRTPADFTEEVLRAEITVSADIIPRE
ncbi:hypothetical protein JW930_07465 [Candidatus Woesearchaeota archaeon]|nr:hypothetical protein [Candidatus Woesearchaeota archaeon]